MYYSITWIITIEYISYFHITQGFEIWGSQKPYFLGRPFSFFIYFYLFIYMQASSLENLCKNQDDWKMVKKQKQVVCPLSMWAHKWWSSLCWSLGNQNTTMPKWNPIAISSAKSYEFRWHASNKGHVRRESLEFSIWLWRAWYGDRLSHTSGCLYFPSMQY